MVRVGLVCLVLVGPGGRWGWAQADRSVRADAGGVVSRLSLPEAPSAAFQAQVAVIPAVTGTVTDRDGEGVLGAEVVLLPGLADEAGAAEPAAAWTGTTDKAGQYVMLSIVPGAYRIRVTAPGFRERTLATELRILRQGETVPTIVLQLAEAKADVEVTITTHEIAREELHAEEQQRVLGVLPNFYTSFSWGAAPLSAGQKFNLASHAKLDPVALAGTAIAASLDEGANRYKGYGTGAAGFGKRFGADFATSTSARFFQSAVFPSIFHQDPRYFYDGHGSVGSRLWYAATRTVVARNDDGSWGPNYSRVLGRLFSAGLANAYLSAGDRSARTTFATAGIGLGSDVGIDVVREFVLKRFTSKVPSHAKGRPEGASTSGGKGLK